MRRVTTNILAVKFCIFIVVRYMNTRFSINIEDNKNKADMSTQMRMAAMWQGRRVKVAAKYSKAV
jgi:hypothetical protein